MARRKIIVVGGGIIAASIAWHLVRDGADVTIFSARLGGVATPNSFAWINANWGNPEPYFRLRRASMAIWKELANSVPDVRPNWCGSICYDLTDDKLKAFATEHAQWGYGIEYLDTQSLSRLEPNLKNVPDIALRIAEEGMIEPVVAAMALAGDAIINGAEWISRDIDGLVIDQNQFKGVVIGGETAFADEVILATGTATVDLLAKFGISIPVESSPGLLMYTRPSERLIDHIIVAPHLEIRQTAGGQIVAASSYAGSEPGEDPKETANAVLKRVKGELYKTEFLEVERFTIGYRPMPKDGYPIVSRIDDTSGLYVAVTHSGITLAPAIGQMVSREILSGERDELLRPYHHNRFAT